MLRLKLEQALEGLKNHSLTQIGLVDNRIGVDGERALAEALKANHTPRLISAEIALEVNKKIKLIN